MKKVIIAGGRNFTDYPTLKKFCNMVINSDYPGEDIQIVSGHAPGADTLGERFAEDFGLQLRCFIAQWEQWGRAAGPIRNREMADYGNMLIAFWDGNSRGTFNMIQQATNKGLRVYVWRTDLGGEDLKMRQTPLKP